MGNNDKDKKDYQDDAFRDLTPNQQAIVKRLLKKAEKEDKDK